MFRATGSPPLFLPFFAIVLTPRAGDFFAAGRWLLLLSSPPPCSKKKLTTEAETDGVKKPGPSLPHAMQQQQRRNRFGFRMLA